VLLKRALSEQEQRLSKLYSEVEMAAVSTKKLLQQQQLQQRSSTNLKPPLWSSGLEEKERQTFLNQPADMATYWHIAEEEGLDEGDGDPSEEKAELVEGNDDPPALPQSGSQLLPPVPHIPYPDIASPAEPLSSQSSLHSQNEAEGSDDGLPTEAHSQSQALEPTTSSRPSTNSIPAEPSSSRRPSHRPSFMRTRRKISAVSSISQPGEPSVPPTKARTSLVRTIPKPDSVLLVNSLSNSQFQEFRQERLAAETSLSNRLRALEKTPAQVNTLREALQILSEEIRVMSEELTGGIKKEIAELKEGQLNSFEEVFRVFESCFLQIKKLQATQAQSKQKTGTSFGMETVQQEVRILQQNMEVSPSPSLSLLFSLVTLARSR
jgi:hypothetical protein